MCGVWGFVSSDTSTFNTARLNEILDRFFTLSESRGKEASGLALVDKSSITVLKRALRAKKLIRSEEYRALLRNFHQRIAEDAGDPIIAMGHARMVTNGSAESHENNQPVIREGMACIHNGIIVNDERLWAVHPDLQRKYEVDTEVMLALILDGRSRGRTLVDAVIAAYREIQGMNTVALVSDDVDTLIIATTNGSLYYSLSPSGKELIFASESYFVEKAKLCNALTDSFAHASVVQVKPGSGYTIDLKELKPTLFNLDTDTSPIEISGRLRRRSLIDLRGDKKDAPIRNTSQRRSTEYIYSDCIDGVARDAIKTLKRCARCLLPETFPLIEYDDKGVCNYCHNYKKLIFAGDDSLKKIADRHRGKTNKPDCIVAISGGRDSCYGIHYVKKELKMNPIAYTYDWGMVTDLARRNISRLCGKLGIEHILVSADIVRKRAYIRKNVLAWLKRPDLGTVPLFMAGDKQYFYYANKIMGQYGIDTFVMSENRLERTHFKHGFCGIEHSDSDKRAYDMKSADTFRLALYYGRQYVLNPAYINWSLIDTIGGFLSFYIIPHNYLYLYNYLYWDENKIENILLGDYDWEMAADTKSTWRIGDGTAPFYNYIYYTVAGFTENDTFRSNQIREGMITREQALDLINYENQPRWNSIKWYCDTIGIDFWQTIQTINSIPKLYNRG
jgi:glutamine---fructose-6-phosphate transaminase (isomerizing)